MAAQKLFLVLLLVSLTTIELKQVEVDNNGYVLYCPCMGRFGNQAEQLLGSIAFAKGLNRTLALPAWIVYLERRPFESHQVPFNEWFKVAPLETYYKKIITMEFFMNKLAPTVWPVEQRKGFCYRFRDGETECSMKEGNPFGPFWDHYGVNFVESVTHKELLWDSDHQPTVQGWKQRFPPEKFPVFAFQGAPGNFPSLDDHSIIHKYLEFSDRISKEADDYIKKEMEGKKYIAIHLRNGIDLKRVCDEVKEGKYQSLFASSQCTQYTEDEKLTYTMCHPSKQEIVKKVKKYIKESKAKALFVATDNDPMIQIFKKELKKLKVSIHQRVSTGEADDAIIDIALLSKADVFIGNCVSTFSAFVRRHREVRGLPIWFFGLDYPPKKQHIEL